MSQSYGDFATPHKISRITPTQICVQINDWLEQKFKIQNGASVVSDAWTRQYIIEPTSRRYEQYEIAILERKAIDIKNKLQIPRDKETLTKFIADMSKYIKQ